MPEESDPGVLAASFAAGLTRGLAGDREMFLSLLVEALRPALGDRLHVQRSGWLRRDGPIRRLGIDLDAQRFTLEVGKGGSLTASHQRVVRGIALKTEELKVEEWLQALAAALADYARTHQEALDALKRRLW